MLWPLFSPQPIPLSTGLISGQLDKDNMSLSDSLLFIFLPIPLIPNKWVHSSMRAVSFKIRTVLCNTIHISGNIHPWEMETNEWILLPPPLMSNSGKPWRSDLYCSQQWPQQFTLILAFPHSQFYFSCILTTASWGHLPGICTQSCVVTCFWELKLRQLLLNNHGKTPIMAKTSVWK